MSLGKWIDEKGKEVVCVQFMTIVELKEYKNELLNEEYEERYKYDFRDFEIEEIDRCIIKEMRSEKVFKKNIKVDTSKLPRVTAFENEYILVSIYGDKFQLASINKEIYIDEFGILRNDEDSKHDLCSSLWTLAVSIKNEIDEKIKKDIKTFWMNILPQIEKAKNESGQISIFDMI